MTVASVPESVDVRDRLRSLGERRAQLNSDGSSLASEISDALAAADGIVSMSEAARLLGVHRTTLYRVYLPSA